MKDNYLALARRHYNCSIEHIESKVNYRLRYAALDMRLAIEAIIYKKFEMIGENSTELPKSMWQPSRLLQIIEQLHPELNTEVQIAIAPVESSETPPPSNESNWIKLPKCEAIDWRNLRDMYGALGNFVHMTTPDKFDQTSYEEIREKLQEIRNELKRLVGSLHLVMNPNLVIKNLCESCGKRLVYSTVFFKQGNTIRCLNENCHAEYKVNEQLGSLEYQSAFKVPCAHCSETIDVHKSQIIRYVGNMNNKESTLKLRCKCAKTTTVYLCVGVALNPLSLNQDSRNFTTS